MLFIIILNILYASTFTIGKKLLSYEGPIFITSLRMLLGGLSLLIYSLFIRKEKISLSIFKNDPKQTIKIIIDLLQIIVLGNFISYVFDFIALNSLTTIKVSFLYNLTPVASAIISYFVLSEKMTPKRWCGLIISFIGCLPILLDSPQINNTNNTPTHNFLSSLTTISFSSPEIALIISMLTYAYSWILMRKLINYKKISPAIVNYLTMFLGGIITLPVALLFEKIRPFNNYSLLASTDFSNFIFFLILIIITGNIVFYNFYGALLKKYTVTFIALSSLLCPLFTAILGTIFLGETVTLKLIISSLVVFLGLYLYYQEEIL